MIACGGLLFLCQCVSSVGLVCRSLVVLLFLGWGCNCCGFCTLRFCVWLAVSLRFSGGWICCLLVVTMMRF